MKEIRLALEENLEVKNILNPELKWYEMRLIKEEQKQEK